MALRNCPNCLREFNASVEGEYCPECWRAWVANDGSFEKRTKSLSDYLSEELAEETT